MSIHTPVPADVEPASMIDLVEDCREVEGTLAPYVEHTIRLPESSSTQCWELPSVVGVDLDGYGEYGS